jgi:hypothetical protein
VTNCLASGQSRLRSDCWLNREKVSDDLWRMVCINRACAEWQRATRLPLKCDGTRAETRLRLSAKRTSPFKSAGTSIHSTTGSRSVRIGGSNAGYTMFRGSVKGTGYQFHSPVSPLLPLPCVTVCHYISTEL